MKLLFLLLVLAVVFGIPTLCHRWIAGFWTATLVASVASSVALGLLVAAAGAVGLPALLTLVLVAALLLLAPAFVVARRGRQSP